MIPLTNKEIKSYEKQKVCHICKEKFCYGKNKKKSEIIAITLENLEEPLTVNAIYDKKYLKKPQSYFIMVQHMIIILQLNN